VALSSEAIAVRSAMSAMAEESTINRC